MTYLNVNVRCLFKRDTHKNSTPQKTLLNKFLLLNNTLILLYYLGGAKLALEIFQRLRELWRLCNHSE